MNSKKIWAGIFAGAALTVLSACLLPVGDGEDLTIDGTPIPATPPDTNLAYVYTQIFQPKCISCHAPGGFGVSATTGNGVPGLDLTMDNAIATMVGIQTYAAQGTAPTLRVDTANPSNSFLIEKVGSGPYKAGGRMPLGQSSNNLTPPEITLLTRWIALGAPQ